MEATATNNKRKCEDDATLEAVAPVEEVPETKKQKTEEEEVPAPAEIADPAAEEEETPTPAKEEEVAAPAKEDIPALEPIPAEEEEEAATTEA